MIKIIVMVGLALLFFTEVCSSLQGTVNPGF